MENYGHNYEDSTPKTNSFDEKQHICDMFGVEQNHEIHKTYLELTQQYQKSVSDILDVSNQQRSQLKSLIATLQQREANATNELLTDNVQEDRKNANVIKLASLHNQLDHYFNDEDDNLDNQHYQNVA